MSEAVDWQKVRDMAAAGCYAADIARAIGWRSDASNLKKAARVRGIEIASMTTSERARRAGAVGGRRTKRKAVAGLMPPPGVGVMKEIRRLLGMSHV